jgi:Ankyrin repeats (3 copies)
MRGATSVLVWLAAACAASLAVAAPAFAQDTVLGTFTVNGKTTRFTNVYVTMEASPVNASQKYLILLVTDAPLAAGDRSPDTLMGRAAAGSLHAVKMRWRYGADDIAVVPYHSGIAESGRAFASMSTVNLSALDDNRVNAEFKSKMLGQTWFFNAIVKAAIVTGGVAILEPDVEAPPTSAAPTAGRGDTTALKRRLGGMGYEFKPDAFFQAISDRKAEAVALFIQAGMSPNQKNFRNEYTLNYAVLFCAQSPEESAAVIQALLAGKADVKTKDPDNGTTPLVGAVQSCSAAAVAALVKAGSDLTAKSNGGATALQLARIYGRTDVAEVLEKAGAK